MDITIKQSKIYNNFGMGSGTTMILVTKLSYTCIHIDTLLTHFQVGQRTASASFTHVGSHNINYHVTNKEKNSRTQTS